MMISTHDKINEALNSDFIGDIFFDQNEMASMCQDCQAIYKKVNQSWSKSYSEAEIKQLIVTIVNIAKKWGEGDENRFWVKIFSEVFDDSSISPTKFYDEFACVFKKYNKTIFISQSGKRMFKEVFLFNAFAPAVSVEAFIKLLWDLFVDEDVLNFSYQPQNEMYLQIAKMLARKFAGNEKTLDDDITFDGKTYSIRAAMKYACNQCPEQVAIIIDRTIREFDSIYFNGQQAENNCYSNICNSVLTKLFATEHVNKERKRIQRTDQIITDLSKIYAGYELNENNQVCVFIPEIRIFDENYNNVKICLYRNNIPIEDYSYNIVGKDIRRRIKKIDIPLTAYIEEFEDIINLRLTLEIDDREIFDSNDKLFRDYILFKSYREVRSNCKPGQYVLFYPHNIQITDYTNVRNLAGMTGKNGNVILEAVEDDYISYNTKTIFFNTEIHNSHFNFGYSPIRNSIMLYKEDEYDIYHKVGNCKLILSGYDIKKLVVIHNEKLTPMNVIVQAKEGNEITIDLSKIQANETGFHKLVISDISNLQKPLHKINYYIDPQLHINFDKEYYFDNDVGNLSVINNGKALLANRVVNAAIDEFSVQIDDATLQIKVPYIRWRIDDWEWLSVSKHKPIWHENLHSGSIIEIDNQSGNDLAISIADQKLQESSHDNNKYLLGSFLTTLLSISNPSKIVINLCIKNKSYKLAQLDYDVELIADPVLSFDNDLLSIDLSNSFIGPENPHFLLEFTRNDEKIQMKCNLIDSIITDKITDGYYDIKLNYIIDGIYEIKYKLLRSYEDYIIGNLDKFYFDNVKIIVKSTKTQKCKVKFERNVIDNITYLTEELYPIYKGLLHIPKHKPIPVEIEKKDTNSVKIFSSGYQLTLLNVNIQKKELTSEIQDGKNILSCSSCYFDEEKI